MKILYFLKILLKGNKAANTIKMDSNSKIKKSNNVLIKNCKISLINSTINLSDSTILSNVNITLINANLDVGIKSRFEGVDNIRPEIYINDGNLSVGICSRIKSAITIRFKGICTIGDYNTINEGTEIRCDEKITIGSFNMISYNCQINDTNTHNILSISERRNQSIKEFPFMGGEYTRPPSKPVVIGDDCWLGKGVTILKGVEIGNASVVGTQAVVTKNIPNCSLAVGNPAIIVKSYE